MASIDGLVSGLNTTQIISQLMAVERLSGNPLLKGRSESQSMATVLQALNASLTGLQTAAKAFIPDSITKASAWTSATASSSLPGLASTSVGPNAQPGTATFTVRSVATAGASITSGSVGSLTTPVSNGPLLLGKGTAALGMASLAAGAQLTKGAHAIAVTQSSAGASLTGAPLADSITIDAGSATVSLEVDGTPTSITLAQGTYSRDQLAAEIGRASGGTLTAGAGPDGALRLATTREGSAASLRLVSPNGALGLGDTATVATGTDAVVTLDGVATTVASLTRGGQVTLGGANGDSMVFTLAGGLRSGAASATVVEVGAGSSLAQVVSSINGAGAGVRATAVQVSANAYRLQLTSMTTGSTSDVSLGEGAFPPGSLRAGWHGRAPGGRRHPAARRHRPGRVRRDLVDDHRRGTAAGRHHHGAQGRPVHTGDRHGDPGRRRDGQQDGGPGHRSERRTGLHRRQVGIQRGHQDRRTAAGQLDGP